jgi:hypothetical protein
MMQDAKSIGHSAWSEDTMLDSRYWMLDARYKIQDTG